MKHNLASLLLTHAIASAAQLPQPVYHFRLDESSGATAYDQYGPPHGTLAGGTLWDANGGHHQGAARFDGVNDRIVLGPCDLTTGGDAFSISFWMKPDFVTGMERTLVAKTIGPNLSDHVWSIAMLNATAPRFRLKTAGVTTELALPPSSLFGGTWYHVAAVYDGAQMSLYINASLMGSTAKSGSIGYHPQAPASIGALSDGTAPFSGWVDDLRIFDLALSQQDIIGILFEDVSTALERIPSDDSASLHALLAASERMRILDSTGRVIREHRGEGTASLGTLGAGIYVLEMRSGSACITRRIALP